MTESGPRVLFEVGFLVDHFTRDLRPNGIQRVGLEVLRAARASSGARVALCRMVVTPAGTHLEPVEFARLEAVCAGAAYIPKGLPRIVAWIRKAARDVHAFLVRHPPVDTASMAPGDVM
ncbi:MAG: hypothetical protein ACREFC_05460, partial [Stellaceae bacterium]